ncbi:hypothetical protein TNCT6_35470 [Streptomyces sp. 6-11-2]|nr:hypothetical protein TNCT6_35470 [Streptomyces sp. 6-11-2]
MFAARRFAPRPEPRTVERPLFGPESELALAMAKAASVSAVEATRAAEQAVTSYGELLQLHPYSPRPSDDRDDLADYQTALEAYEEAKQSPAAKVPEILERGREALERLDVAARAAGSDTQWIHGSGRTRARVPNPVTDGPALLIFETDQGDGDYVVSGKRRGRSREFLRGTCGGWGTRAQVLVPPQRDAMMPLEVSAPGPWRIELRPADEARQLCWNAPLKGRGPESVAKVDGSGVVEFEHHGEGAFKVYEVTQLFHKGPLLAEGQGEARLTIAVPHNCLLRIDADGRWTLRDPQA